MNYIKVEARTSRGNRLAITPLGEIKRCFYDVMQKTGWIESGSKDGHRVEFDDNEIDTALECLQSIKKQRDEYRAKAKADAKG